MWSRGRKRPALLRRALDIANEGANEAEERQGKQNDDQRPTEINRYRSRTPPSTTPRIRGGGAS